MDNKRRHKFDIIAEILKHSTNGTKKTQLVYSSNINFNILNKYLEPLMARGFIEPSGGLYYTTPAGFEFLYMYDALMNVWKNGEHKNYAEEMRAIPKIVESEGG